MQKSKTQAGGQAVIEGVMMRVGRRVAVAVRSPGGQITVREEAIEPLARRYSPLGWPIIRGAVSLVESLSVGMRALMYSANAQAESEEEELSSGEMLGAVVFSVALAVLLFILLPTALTSLADRLISGGLVLNLVEGGIRLGVVITYIAAIGYFPDVGRVLEYHGAEHKVIRAWEISGELPSVEHARCESTVHVRCGTSFILMVAVVSIFIYSLFGWSPSFWARIGMRLALLPIVAGIAYEVISGASRWHNAFISALMLPGLWLQRLTTREPADDQLEVAIEALGRCLNHNKD